MSTVVNLRQVRKRKARADREQQAAENRSLHGRSKAEKTRDASDKLRADAFVDGHRLKPSGDKT
jgi:hypothetical protein